jgi:hypothetical protein
MYSMFFHHVIHHVKMMKMNFVRVLLEAKKNGIFILIHTLSLSLSLARRFHFHFPSKKRSRSTSK